jgi:hypothetical protein
MLFGDSLLHPYLQEELTKQGASVGMIRFIGAPCSKLQRELDILLKNGTISKRKYDYIVIVGGLNKIRHEDGRPYLKKMYQAVVYESMCPILVTLPNPKQWYPGNSIEIRRFKRINQMINSFHYIQMPFSTEIVKLEKIIGNNQQSLTMDGVHLNRKGHKLWAKEILSQCNR